MGLLEQLLGANNGAAVDQIGRQLGLDASQTTSALEALLPTVAAGFQRSASSGAGLEGLLGALTGGAPSRYADDLSQLGQPAAVDDGNNILGQIFGSKDVSREVAARASAQTGIGADVLKAMLPMVAAMVMGAMAKGAASGGTRLGQATGATGGGGLLDMLTPMLDSNRDGSVMDDIAGMMGKYMRGR
jgi:hypothetical protein